MRPSVLIFDVNETLSDMSPLGARFVELGASATAAPLWFASVLRDGFALTAAGQNPRFADVARAQLVSQLAQLQLNRSVEDAASHVMAGFAALEVHPDVISGLSRLHEDGHRLATLTNGATAVAERLLGDAGVLDRFERLLSVEDAGAAGGWKPSPVAYRYALDTLGVAAQDAVLVAVHPWDVDGARRAGLQTVYVDRSGGDFPAVFERPTYTVGGVDEIADLFEEPGARL